jgi:glycogen debranching enzyme
VALLEAATVVNPVLYVCAELFKFTGSEDTDKHFVSRLGINSLIRELGNGGDTKEMSRLSYKYEIGKPVGRQCSLLRDHRS